MSKSTKKKQFKKRYETRFEKNKKIYYSHKNSKEIGNNIKGTLITILSISIIVNAVCGFSIYNLKSDNKNLKRTNETNQEALEKIEKDYKNYLFLGDSITDYYNLEEYFPNEMVVNSGISGDKTEDILNDMNERIYKYNPSKIFLLIGTNDINAEIDNDEILNRIKKIVEGIEENRGSAKIYVESIYPVNKKINKLAVEKRTNEDIKYINSKLKEYCEENDLIYINMFDELIDENGNFDKNYTDDGLHPNEECYKKVTDLLEKYLND